MKLFLAQIAGCYFTFTKIHCIALLSFGRQKKVTKENLPSKQNLKINFQLVR